MPHKDKEKDREYHKMYQKTYKGIKSRRTRDWKRRGIIFHDYNWLYDVYLSRHTCDYCNKEFKNDKDRCLDHNHSITDDRNVRGILCNGCNVKDVLKNN